MMVRKGVCLLLVSGLASLVLVVRRESPTRPEQAILNKKQIKSEAMGILARLPLPFEVNQGQAPADAQFVARGNGVQVLLDSKGASFRSLSSVKGGSKKTARMRWVGGREVMPEGAKHLPGKANYFVGDQKTWHSNISTYEEVRYTAVYPGVDLVYYGDQSRVEYDFVVAPAADPLAITLEFTDDSGRRYPVKLDASGALLVTVDETELTMHPPRLYQTIDGERREVTGGYALRADSRVGFEIGSYDRRYPLMVDPVLAYSTYLSGATWDYFEDVVVDSSGNSYFVGSTDASRVATLIKLNSAGSAVLYSVTFGVTISPQFANPYNSGISVAIDSAGQASVAGITSTNDFPTVSAFQSVYGGGSSDAFVSKFAADGSSLIYSTYFGGSGNDAANGIAVDDANNTYITGSANSANAFPLQFPLQGFNGTQDAFVAKLIAGGSALAYSTFLGGSGLDSGEAIAVDTAGNASVVGWTESANFPVTTNVSQNSLRGSRDAFVTSLNASGSAWRYSTYLGGTAIDEARDLVLDATGNVIITGWTRSTDFPYNRGPQSANAGGADAFVTVLDGVNSFTKILFSTYIGGASDDRGDSVAVDSAGNAYVTGPTSSTDFPSVRAFQLSFGGGYSDGFVVKLSTHGGPFLYASYIGGNSGENQYALYFPEQTWAGVAVIPGGAAYIVGATASDNFPTLNPLQGTAGGSYDGFAAKVAVQVDLRLTMTDSPDPANLGNTVTYVLTVNNLGPDVATNVRVTDTLPAGMSFVSATPSQGSCTGTSTVTCSLGLINNPGSATVTIRVAPSTIGTKTNSASVTRFETDPVNGNNTASVTTTVRSHLGVTVSSAPGATGSVSSLPSGISCGNDCEQFYTTATTVRLTANPGATSEFRGWSGDCSGTGVCILSMSQNHSVTADFGLPN